MTEEATANPEMAPPAIPPPPPKRSRSERREQAAGDVLRTFIRDLHLERHGATTTLPNQEQELLLRVRLTPGKDWEFRFEPSLEAQVSSQLEEATAEWNVFRKGHVYCFRCESSSCEHSVPSSPLCVFNGYASNGLPEWSELAQVLIAAKHERVDRLFDERRPEILAFLQYGRDLKTRQLSSFGRSSKTYSILGQVVAGYFALPRKQSSNEGARVAITYQAVEVRGEGGSMNLQLNRIVQMPGEEDLSDLLISGWHTDLERAQELTERALSSIEQRAAAARARNDANELGEAMRQVPNALRRMVDSIQRGDRQGARRTHHVERRRTERRPVHKAIDDAMEVKLESLFYDEKTSAMVVCGGQGRAHVFNEHGQHITSFTLQPDSIDYRLRTQRWRPATPEELETLKKKIRGI